MKNLYDDPKILAFALDELEGPERDETAAQVEADPELQKLVDEYHELNDALRDGFKAEPAAALTDNQRASIESALQAERPKPRLFTWCLRIAAVAVLGVAAWIGAQVFQYSRQDQTKPVTTESDELGKQAVSEELATETGAAGPKTADKLDSERSSSSRPPAGRKADLPGKKAADMKDRAFKKAPAELLKPEVAESTSVVADDAEALSLPKAPDEPAPMRKSRPRAQDGSRLREAEESKSVLARDLQKGLGAPETAANAAARAAPGSMNQKMERAESKPRVDRDRVKKEDELRRGYAKVTVPAKAELRLSLADSAPAADARLGSHDRINENKFISAWTEPFSTFSIDVDTASYTMVRKQLTNGRLPAPDAVRIEEMINYFDYEYEPPEGKHPFAVHLETASCPWNQKHRLVRIGLKGKEIPNDQRPAANLVFLLDVSGSMNRPDKLPLVKGAMEKLTAQLKPADRVAIVVYAGAAGVVLPATRGDNQQRILESLSALRAGGSTAGGAGIKLAYDMARKNFVKDGINRVILCTDGDFNVGVTGRGGLERLIEEKAKTGVFLTILGFGRGNYKDDRMEALSNKGNGNYAYIDSLAEAEKVLVKQVGGTLMTIAKDVKIQVNFNKYKVHSYRLIGYENRMLTKQDFNDDKKDAGEIGAGITVTALYEVVPLDVADVDVADADEDKYAAAASPADVVPSNDMLTVRLRYKQPTADKSTLLEVPLVDKGKTYSEASNDFKFASVVAAFGMILRDSKYRAGANYGTVLELAAEGAKPDPHGYRQEFLDLVKKAKALSK